MLQRIRSKVFIINNIPKDKCLVNHLWFHGPPGGSALYARSRDLGDVARAFGVLRETAEGGSQSSGYVLSDIRNANLATVSDVFGSVPELKGLGQRLTDGLLKRLRSQ